MIPPRGQMTSNFAARNSWKQSQSPAWTYRSRTGRSCSRTKRRGEVQGARTRPQSRPVPDPAAGTLARPRYTGR
jgi:hypothetical protein